MPSTATITAFYTFVSGDRFRENEGNNNFNILRGHLIPIRYDIEAAADGDYDLGSDEHRWRSLYSQDLNLEGLTSSTDSKFIPKSTTAGGLNILNGASTIGSWSSSGFLGSLIQTATIPDAALVKQPPELMSQEFLTSGSFVVPTLVDLLMVEGCGGGGGGGGAYFASATITSAGYGAGGGGGAPLLIHYLPVTPGQTLTVSIGAGGAGGGAGISGSSGTASVFGSITFPPGQPGYAATTTGFGIGSTHFLCSADGGNGAVGASAVNGQSTPYATGGAAGVYNSGGGSGGGGGSAFGSGGAGGAGGAVAGSGSSGSNASDNSGGGGGGGGGKGVGGAGSNGSGGNGGSGRVKVYWVRTPT